MMITEHLAAGILIANSNKKFKSPKFIIISIASSVLADLPVLFLGGPGKVDYLSHRIYTHSIILSPLYALIPIIFGLVFYYQSFKKHFLSLYLVSIISFLSHIFLDFLTPYGVQLFYPFSNTIYSADFFHSLDPIFITISLSIIIIFIFKRLKNQYFNKSILLSFISLILIYSIYTRLSKSFYTNKYSSSISISKNEINYITTVPRTFWRWKGIAEDNKRNYIFYMKNDTLFTKSYIKKIITPSTVLKSTDYKKFINYARFPIIIKQDEKFSCINLIYTPKSYRLTYELDNNEIVKSSHITSFNIYDEY